MELLKGPKMNILFILLYFLCGWLGYGIILSYCIKKFPLLYTISIVNSKEECNRFYNELRLIAVTTLICGPIGLLAAVITCDTLSLKHMFTWKNPATKGTE